LDNSHEKIADRSYRVATPSRVIDGEIMFVNALIAFPLNVREPASARKSARAVPPALA